MKVYQLKVGMFGPRDESWMAITEEGEVLCTHVSSGRGWGIRDTGPEGFYADRYPADAEVIVLPDGENVPPEVLAANKARYADTPEGVDPVAVP